MIDYVRLVLVSTAYARTLRLNPLLRDSWVNYTKESTGNRISYASYKGLRFKVYPSGRVEADGSLHKFFNGGEHNYNDFSYANLLESLISLKNAFGEELLSARVENLEYGLNVIPSFASDDFLKRIIVYLKRGARLKQPITKEDSKGFTKGIKFILDQYQIKVYNKGKQYNQGENLLRCEFKTVKMKSIEDVEVKLLSDLTDVAKLHKLHSKLMEAYSNIVIREDFNNRDLTRPEEKIYNQCINPEFWVSMTKHQRTERKLQYKALVDTKSLTDIKAIVLNLLDVKHQQMAQSCKKSYYLLTELFPQQESEASIQSEPLRILKTHYLLTGGENLNNLPINRLYNV